MIQIETVPICNYQKTVRFSGGLVILRRVRERISNVVQNQLM